MVGRFIRTMEEVPLTLGGWFAAFLGILMVRYLLENFSNAPTFGFVTSDASTIIHYYFFYLAVLLSLMLILRIFIKDSVRIAKFLIFGLIVTWSAPILDIVYSSGAGFKMAYIFQDAPGLLRSLFAFFGTPFTSGITPGIKTEMFLVMAGFFVYIYYSTKSLVKSALAAILGYAAMFFWESLPSVIKIIHDAFVGSSAPSVIVFFGSSMDSSILSKNFLHPTIQLSYLRNIEVLFNAAMSQVYYIVIFSLAALWSCILRAKQTVAVFKNSRPERVAHYFLMILFGILVAWKLTSPNIVWNWLDITSLASLFLAYYCAWMFAVGVNDIADVEIDKISNNNRPLIKGEVSVKELKEYNLFFFVWSLAGGFVAGHYALFMIGVFTSAYYIFSSSLRLKRLPIISTFLISIASLSAVLAGFYITSANKTIEAFPISYLALIIIVFTLGANLKDLKDIEGDRAEGIKTIPALLGKERGKMAVGFLVA